MKRSLAIAALALVAGAAPAAASAATPEQIARYNAVADQTLGANSRCYQKAMPHIENGPIAARDDTGNAIEADGVADGITLDDANPANDVFYSCDYRVVNDLPAYDTCLVVLHERMHLEGVHHSNDPNSLMTRNGIIPERIHDPGCMTAVGRPRITTDDVYAFSYEHMPAARGAWTTMQCKTVSLTVKRCVIAYRRYAGGRIVRKHYRFWRNAQWGITVTRLK